MSTNTFPESSRTLTIRQDGSADGKMTLTCQGRITLETGEHFKSEVKNLAIGYQQVLADLGGVDFVDSSGLGCVLAAYLSAKSAGCELRLINVNPRVRDLLNITRLTAVLEEGALPK
jgi:anti-sigma B factor antagonist